MNYWTNRQHLNKYADFVTSTEKKLLVSSLPNLMNG